VRSRQGGLEIEFTQPVGQMAEQTSLYTLTHWHYTPTSDYYNDPQDVAPLTVSKVLLSTDRKQVYLEISGMTAGKVVQIKVGSALQSQAGQTLWTPDAYYTLNSISNSPALSTPIISNRNPRPSHLRVHSRMGPLRFQWERPDYTTLSIQDIQGTVLKTMDVSGLQTIQMAENLNHQGMLIAKLQGKNQTATHRFMNLIR
jgi:hypothetical protein